MTKEARSIFFLIISILTAIWFVIADHTVWWMAILLGFASYGCFSWTNQKVSKTGWWLVAMIVCIVAVRFAALPIIEFLILIWVGIIAAAFAVIGWGFKDLGIVGGVIILLLVGLFLRNLVK